MVEDPQSERISLSCLLVMDLLVVMWDPQSQPRKAAAGLYEPSGSVRAHGLSVWICEIRLPGAEGVEADMTSLELRGIPV